MSTLSQIREQTRILLNDATPSDGTSPHFPDSDLNDFINQAIRYTASQIEYPRTFQNWQATEGEPEYTLASNTLIILTAYFGDTSIQGDIRPLKIMSEETLKEIKPSWLDEHSSNRGRPERLILKDRNTIFVDPPPDAASSVTGKKIYTNYVYFPATLSVDGNSPDLPLPYHDILQFYAAHLGALKKDNRESAGVFLTTFNEKINVLKPVVTKETKEGMAFQWGYSETLDTEGDWQIVF